ncbi:hypothetical protein [Caulobacter segnis]|uniref:Uncharacterized protein n=1 Tax=Caulobacter segnis TaxID=88688 RepID=A0A2W5UVP8_9CAUL|nr:hypothetical protein [Caulobacter segnis]PZR31082.1 MAG: hypothetical protein DI526_20705 [Caulobacter segnis]
MIKVERIKIESRVADNVRALAHLRGVSLSEAIDIAVREMMSPDLRRDDRGEKVELHTDADREA